MADSYYEDVAAEQNERAWEAFQQSDDYLDALTLWALSDEGKKQFEQSADFADAFTEWKDTHE